MDTLIELRELYGKARKYMDEEWKKDPETEPYKSKYKAMEYLKSIKEKLVDSLDNESDSTQRGMLAVVLLQMGVISLDTEEMSLGETYLNEALKIVSNDDDPRFILVTLTARNQLGILWCQRSEYEKAKEYLEDCEALYTSFMASCSGEGAMSLHEHFDASKEAMEVKGSEEIEKVRM